MKKTLNIGAGERIYKFYPTDDFECINFDERNINGIDVIGDVRNLNSFEDENFDYILASDIIEHFPISETQTVLKEWIRVLKQECIMEFRLPNLEAIVSDYLKRKDENRNDIQGNVPIAHYFSWLLYGGQDYPGNFHYVGFDRNFFKHTIEVAGLKEIDWQKDGYNMIVKCRKENA